MNNAEIIKRLEELFEESIIMLPDEHVLENLKPNPAFKKHYDRIKRLNTKAKAETQKSISVKARENLNNLIKNLDENQLMDFLSNESKNQSFIPALYSKFEKMTDEDKKSMLADKKLIEFIKRLKIEMENEEKKAD